MKCPLCDGVGTIKKGKEEKRQYIQELHRRGLTFRQIAKVVGLKSTSTIAYYLIK